MTRDTKGRPAATKRPKPAPGADAAPPAGEGDGRQRIAKLMARVGLCSRREAEVWIADGRVVVNGERLTSPARDVGPEDEILVDDAPLPMAEKTRLFLFHKPRGLVTSDYDPEGRDTVADFLRDNWPEGPRTVTVGRLDINTEGLLLLTNDGGLARVLELPQTGWVRRYRVRAKGTIDQPRLDTLAEGLTIDGIDYAGIEARLDRIQGANCWLTMGLREGKNREIKRVLEHVGLEVNRLIRLSFGPFQLLDLEEGAVEEVRTRVLRDQLGESLAALAGVDFGDAEVAPEPARGRDAGRPQRRDERDHPAAEAPPPPERHERAAGPRRHVSTLRATEANRAKTAPRKRTERSDVTDVKARKVAVERRMLVRPPVGEEAAPRRGRKTASPSAEGKRARIARSGGGRSRDNAQEERQPRFEGARGPRRDRPDGEPRRAPRSGDRPERRETRPAFGERNRTPRPDGDTPRPRGPRPDDRGDRREARATRPERTRPERARFDERGTRPTDNRRDAGPRADRPAPGGSRRPEGDDRRKPVGTAEAKPLRGVGGAGRGGPPGKGAGRAPGKPAGRGPYKGPAKASGKGPGKPRGPAAPRR